jgi:two-component system sensor histidine kinase KdpD
MVEADMVLTEQVLFNLFDNAAKYAPERSRIEVSAAQENGFVTIRVRPSV